MCRSRGERSAGPLRQGVAVAVWVVALMVSGCGGSASRPSLDQDAREYVRLAFALGERDPD
jgi:hypothetical protein